MELGKRLNILREQFGREQAASLEETYKQSREGGEEEETGRRAEYKSGGETGGRRRAEDQSRDYKASKLMQSDTVKFETEGENDFQMQKVDLVNVSPIEVVSPENEMDQDQTEHQKSETSIDSMSFPEKGNSQGNNSLAISRSTSMSHGANQKEQNMSQMILIRNRPEKSSEKNLQALDESQYPLADTGSKANLDFVTLKAAPTFPRNTKYSKEAKSAWKQIMSGKERKMPETEDSVSHQTNEVIAADADTDADTSNTKSENIKSNLEKGEHMLRSMGSTRNIRRKLPIRTT